MSWARAYLEKWRTPPATWEIQGLNNQTKSYRIKGIRTKAFDKENSKEISHSFPNWLVNKEKQLEVTTHSKQREPTSNESYWKQLSDYRDDDQGRSSDEFRMLFIRTTKQFQWPKSDFGFHGNWNGSHQKCEQWIVFVDDWRDGKGDRCFWRRKKTIIGVERCFDSWNLIKKRKTAATFKRKKIIKWAGCLTIRLIGWIKIQL